MKKMIIKRIVYGILLTLTFALIFYFSAANETSSGNMSRKVTEIITTIFKVEEVNREVFINKAIPYVRKIAHFSVYALAGIWEILFLNTYNIKDEKKIAFGACIGLLYAISDEIHQGFTPGRSPKVIDVIIDLEGNLFGILFILLFIKGKMQRQKSNKKEA